ncbi:MAG: Calx-beta domain-containing protein, partial [Bacteroidota bacterium]
MAASQTHTGLNSLSTLRNFQLFLIGLLSIVNLSLQAQTLNEDFEDEMTMSGGVTFSQGGYTFSAPDFDLSDFDAANFTQYIQPSDFSATGSKGSITLTTAGVGFVLNSLDPWTSDASVASFVGGQVTFRGTRTSDGSTVDAMFTTAGGSSTGYGNTINFSGSNLDGVQLSSVEIILGSGLTYISIDNFNFTGAPIGGGQSFTISDVSQMEGNSGTTNFSFAVTRSGNTGTASVTAATANGTALAGADYTATGPTVLNFANGVATVNFVVPVLGDNIFEGDETFVVNLSNESSGTAIVDGQGVGTIEDDDTECEDFETEANGTMAFSQGSVDFTMSGNLAIVEQTAFPSFTDYVEAANSTGNVGAFTIVPSQNLLFTPVFIDTYLSTDTDGANNTDGNLTFIGTRLNGSTVTFTTEVLDPDGSEPEF